MVFLVVTPPPLFSVTVVVTSWVFSDVNFPLSVWCSPSAAVKTDTPLVTVSVELEYDVSENLPFVRSLLKLVVPVTVRKVFYALPSLMLSLLSP